jgi:hypothetical protein
MDGVDLSNVSNIQENRDDGNRRDLVDVSKTEEFLKQNVVTKVEGSCKERNRQLRHSAQPIRTISVNDVFGYLRRDPRMRMSLVTGFFSKHVENGHI